MAESKSDGFICLWGQIFLLFPLVQIQSFECVFSASFFFILLLKISRGSSLKILNASFSRRQMSSMIRAIFIIWRKIFFIWSRKSFGLFEIKWTNQQYEKQ